MSSAFEVNEVSHMAPATRYRTSSMDFSGHIPSSKRGRSGSISGRLRAASDLEEIGWIDKNHKGVIKDLIISGDLTLRNALDKYEHGDAHDLEGTETILARTHDFYYHVEKEREKVFLKTYIRSNLVYFYDRAYSYVSACPAYCQH